MLNKHNFFRQGLSVVLILAILVPIIPATVFAAEKIKIDFTTFNVSGSSNVEGDLKGDNWETLPLESSLYSGAAYHGVVTSDGKETAGRIAVRNGTDEWIDSADAKWTIEADIGTTEAGYYNVDITGAQIAEACEYYIYVDEQYAGIYNFNGSSNESSFKLTAKTLNTVYLTPDANGKVKIMFAYASSGNRNQEVWISRIYVNSITLTKTDGYTVPDFSEIVTDIPEEMFEGEQIDISAYAKMSDGSTYHANGWNADHTQSNDYGVSVSILSDPDGILTLTHTNAYGEYWRPTNGGSGNHTSFDGIYEGSLSAKYQGTATIRLTAHIGELSYDKDIDITVKEGVATPVTYEFSSSTLDGRENNSKSPQDWVVKSTNWSIIPEKTTTITTNAVDIEYLTLQVFSGSNLSAGWLDVSVAEKKELQFAIKGRVYKEGWYKVSFQGYRFKNEGGKIFLYVDGQYAGEYDFLGDEQTGGKLGEIKSMNTLYLTPENGYVEIILAKPVGAINSENVNTKNINPYRISLTPVDVADSEIGYSDVKSTAPVFVYVGEEAKADFSAELSDGSLMHWNGYDANGTADDSYLLSVTGDEFVEIKEFAVNDGVVNAVILGKKIGEGTITVSGFYNDVPFSKNIGILVKPIPRLDKAILSFENPALPVSRETKTILSLVRDDGEPYTGEYSVVYSSADEKTAEVTAEGKVIGKKEGKALIKAEVTAADGAKATAEAEINITKKPVLTQIIPDVKTALLIGGSEHITVGGVMSDGLAADMSGYSITFESSDTEIVTVSDSGIITANKAGAVIITVKAENADGEKATVNVTVQIYDKMPPVIIDFTTANVTTSDVENELKGKNWATLPEESNLYMNAAYQAVYNAGTSNVLNVTISSYNGGDRLKWLDEDGHTSNWTVEADLDTTTPGYYDVSVCGAKLSDAGEFYVYVDGKYAGIYNCNGTSNVGNFTLTEKKLNTLYLEPDENEKVKIMFAYAGAGTRNSENYIARLYVNNVTFSPAEGFEGYHKATLVSEISEEMAIGEIVDIGAYLRLSDGSKFNINGYTADRVPDGNNKLFVSLENEGGNIVTLSATKAFGKYYIPTGGKGNHTDFDGEYNGTLTAVEEGEVYIRIDAVADGNDYSKIAKVTVKDDPLASTSAEISAKELFAGDSCRLIALPKLRSGRITSSTAVVTTYESLDENIVLVNGNILTAVRDGKAKVKVKSTFNNVTEEAIITVNVLPEGMTDVEISAGGSEYIRLTDDANDVVPLFVKAISNLGNEIDMTGAKIFAEALNPEYAMLDADLNIIPVAIDEEKGYAEASFAVTLETADGRIRTKEKMLTVVNGKAGSSLYTAEKLDAVRKNVKKFDWVKKEADKTTDKADFYADNAERIYDLIVAEGLPRINKTGSEPDPNKMYCRYCRVNLQEKYGSYPWLHNPLNRPFKVQCPDCKRLFPSNSFEKFYKLGLNKYGEFDRMRALEAHREKLLAMNKLDLDITEPGEEYSDNWYAYYGYGVPEGYLCNELYENLNTAKNPANSEEPFLRAGEKAELWGVDDGYGYVPRSADGTPYMLKGKNYEIPERHPYIAEYLFNGLWSKQDGDSNGGLVVSAVKSLTNAYYYTGDIKYGRALAILIDRIGDFYADYDMTRWDWETWRSSDTCQGKLLDHVWENGPATMFAKGYDITYELYEDTYVLDFINKKAKEHKFRHAKETPSQIRTSIEDGVLRGALSALTGENSYVKGQVNIGGNFGYPQSTNANVAVILDTMPETKKWIDYLMAPGWDGTLNAAGGGINEKLIDDVCHDGMGNEASEYNVGWLTSLMSIADVLAGYERYQAASLYNNPKFVEMFYANIPIMSTYFTPQIGDSGSTAGAGHWMSASIALAGWKNIGDPVFAQVMYMLNGNSVDGLHYEATHPNPEILQDEVKQVIEQYGTFNPSSEMMTGFGFGILRDGADYSNGNKSNGSDVRRNTWMYFGYNAGHGHTDVLNLGLTAYGLDFMPDLGYPAQTGMDPNRLQWVAPTLSHNTVLVNEKGQNSSTVRSKSLHFDDAGQVAVMDVDAPDVYRNEVDVYRRSVVTVRVDDNVSYTVDFFRVLGGNNHLYSLHAASDEISETSGLALIPQQEDGRYKGSYAGINVPYGPDPNSPQQWDYETVYPRGYTWLDHVDRDSVPDEKFEIDFAIKDFNKNISNSKNLHMRMTVLDKGNRDGRETEVAIANGYAPLKAENKNIDLLKYVLIKHSGEQLDTTFTSVFEPYRDERYLSCIDELDMKLVEGTGTDRDSSRAIRVEHKSGRIDYVLYSTNNKITYEIELDDGNKLRFRGFVGVYTVINGVNTYKYLHDGDILGEPTQKESATEGVVLSFTEDYAFENQIVIRPDANLSEEEVKALANRYVIIENDGTLNSAYKIQDAYSDGSNVVLDIGRKTLIRKFANSRKPEFGYVYNIAAGQKVRIPQSYIEEFAPEFMSVPQNLTTSAGSTLSVTLQAASSLGNNEITYKASVLPRGASFDEKTATVTWKPDNSQVGESHFAIIAVDSFGREKSAHFDVTVYGRTTGTPEKNTEEGGNSESTGASGGGGGGGVAPSEKSDGTVTDEQTGASGESWESDFSDQTDAGTGVPDAPEFTDLSDYEWAQDAINALASNGVIRGTSPTTFSPASNITRADFASLLVRAFKLTSDNIENFADVTESDYFAAELAIARNTGIVSGIGDNKFAPRSSITRQDMMVIVYRALEKLGAEFVACDKPEYEDFDIVADYAKSAVSSLIGTGLINGKNGKIAPLDNTTRAEVAVLLQRISEYAKK